MKFVLAICLLVVSVQATDYCEPSLCRKGSSHVACNANPGYGKPDAYTIPFDSDKQAMIVQLHNEMRNKIALGKQNYTKGFYPTAARMTTMQWDDELAFIAAANARKCVFKHDQCRNTVKYPISGQNIGIFGYGGTRDPDVLITKLFNMWYAEYKHANPEITKKYPKGYKGPVIGHFTQVVQDRADRIGCAVTHWTDKPYNKLYLVCNYARVNVVGQPVYTPGDVGSQCTTGTNSEFPGLCSPDEVISYKVYN
ncbi:antigen 5 like allergen Cul n 1-like [Uranotaenia lowii]|uniref:antigen 5 like allergen Cul n 1-like n=1 Tax=Uranotaenia lowii TaxID=190385 RepID=UPI00247A3A5F|nr:antigen 5 like allergen Cul n 1-like [Uranotaenia lowii]